MQTHITFNTFDPATRGISQFPEAVFRLDYLLNGKLNWGVIEQFTERHNELPSVNNQCVTIIGHYVQGDKVGGDKIGEQHRVVNKSDDADPT